MHTIRLRGPWQLEPVFRYVRACRRGVRSVRPDELPAAAKMTMPADWSAAFGDDFLGRVRYVRTFNSPPGLRAGRAGLASCRAATVGRASRDGGGNARRRRRTTAVRSGSTSRIGSAPYNRIEIFVDHPALVDEESAFLESATVSTRRPGGRSPTGNRRIRTTMRVISCFLLSVAICACLKFAQGAEPHLFPLKCSQRLDRIVRRRNAVRLAAQRRCEMEGG